MAERRYNTFYDLDGTQWRVSIYDSSFASTATVCNLNEPGFTIKWSGDGDERFAPVKESECVVPFVVENGTDATLISNIVGAQEERFAIRIQKGDDLYWVGWINCELVNIEDTSYPYTVELTATDGIGRLRDIEYWNAGTPYSGSDVFKTIAVRLMNKVGLSDFWDTYDDFVRTEINWIEDNHPAVASNIDPWEYSRVDNEVFLSFKINNNGDIEYDLDEDGNQIVKSCYDVLYEICKAWGCRMYHAGGVYRFQQVNELEGTSIYYRTWLKSDVPNNNGTYNPRLSVDQSSVAKLATGIDSFYPALLRVNAERRHNSYHNLITNPTLAWDTDLSSTSFGNVEAGGGNHIEISGRVEYDYTMASPYNELHYSGVAIQVWLDTGATDYYLDGSNVGIAYSTNYNQPAQGPIWVTAGTGIYYVWHPGYNTATAGNYYIPFSVQTMSIPADATLKVAISFIVDPITGSAGGTPTTYTYRFDNLAIKYVDTNPSNTKLYEVVNTTNGTTYVDSRTPLDLGEVLIGDSITTSTIGSIEVTPNAINWSYSSLWNVGGSGTQYDITELLCREVLSGQKTPTRIMQAAITSSIDPHDVLVYDGLVYAFRTMTLVGSDAQVNGEWFCVKTDDDYTLTTVDDEVIEDNGVGLGTLSLVTGITQSVGQVTAAEVNYNQRRSVATTSSRLAAGDTVDEVDIDAIGSQILSQGDVLTLFNPYDGSYETVTIDETPTADATTVAIESTTLDYDYPPGSMLFYTNADEMRLAFDPTKTGWDDDYESNVTLAFVDGTRTFSITPTGSEFYYYINGVKFVKDSAQSVVIDDTEGTWFIYFVQGTLTASQTPWSIAANDKAFVSVLYWDATNKEAILAPAYEMHGWVMDSAVHHYLHSTFGARWQSGLAVSINGTTTIDVSAGSIHDEDIQANITDGAGSSTWEQALSPAECPILYRDGASGYWRRIDASTTPCYLDTNVLQYNAYEGGVWSLEDCALNKYVAYWVLATTCVEEPIILIPGQEQGDTLDDARDGNSSADMLFGNLPVSEFKIIARLLVSRIAGSPYYSVEEVNDYRSSSGDSSSSAPLVGDHGSLTGLLDDDHSQYMAMARAGDISGLSAKTTPVAADVLVIEDSAASNAKKKVTVESLWRVPTGTKTTGVDNGTTGDIYVDDDWLYICTDTNVWKKTALHNTA